MDTKVWVNSSCVLCSENLIGSHDGSSGLSSLGGLDDVLDHRLLGLGRGGNLSGSWLNSHDLWSHVLVFKDLLVLDRLLDAVELGTLPNGKHNHTPDQTEKNDTFPEGLSFGSSLLFVHVWESVEPVLVWIFFLPVILFGVRLVVWRVPVLFVII